MSTPPLGYWPSSEPFPALLTDAQMQVVFGISSAQYYKLKKVGKFRMLEAKPPVMKRTRYSGALVARYVEGNWSYARTFGRRLTRLFHGAHVPAETRTGVDAKC